VNTAEFRYYLGEHAAENFVERVLPERFDAGPARHADVEHDRVRWRAHSTHERLHRVVCDDYLDAMSPDLVESRWVSTR
jgi:hypothetical protein